MKRARIVLPILLLFCFFLFSISVDKGLLREYDFAVTVKLQDNIPTHGRWIYVNNVLESIGFFAAPFTILIMAIGTSLLFVWKTNGWKKRALILFFIPLGLLGITGIELYGKTVVEQSAPQFFMLRNAAVEFPKYHIQEGNTYPSGHAARSVYIALLVFFLTMKQFSPFLSCFDRTTEGQKKEIITRRKKTRVTIVISGMLAVYIISIGVSKVLLGHHWMSDIVGGWFLGGVFGGVLTSILL